MEEYLGDLLTGLTSVSEAKSSKGEMVVVILSPQIPDLISIIKVINLYQTHEK